MSSSNFGAGRGINFMHISLIAAMTKEGVIGKNNTLPWHIPEDLKYFRSQTLGKPVIMGRKTFLSMNSKPLPNRQNIILTHDLAFKTDGCIVVHSKEEALKAVQVSCEEVMIIGGSQIYQEFLSVATRLYISRIHESYSGDTYFPKINWEEWALKEENKHEQFTALIYEKKQEKTAKQ